MWRWGLCEVESTYGTGALLRDPGELPRPSTMKSRSQKRATYKPKSKLSSDATSVDALILDFPTYATVRNRFLLFLSQLSIAFCHSSLSRIRHQVKILLSVKGTLRLIRNIFLRYLFIEQPINFFILVNE